MSYELWCPGEWIDRYLAGERRCPVPAGAGVGDTVKIRTGTTHEPGRAVLFRILSIQPSGGIFEPEATTELIKVLA